MRLHGIIKRGKHIMKLKGIFLKSMMNRAHILAGLCCMMAFTLSGCFANYGRLHWDPQVTTAFENNTIEKDLNYYYHGVGNRTFAIAGISAEYNIKSKMWREVPQDSEAFQGFVSRAWINYAYKPYYPQGAFILDPEGKQVGTWYSSLRFVTVKFAENNRIVIIPDTPFLGGPEADAVNGAGERISRIESNPFISHQLKALLASQ
jgi:hypothetical protein